MTKQNVYQNNFAKKAWILTAISEGSLSFKLTTIGSLQSLRQQNVTSDIDIFTKKKYALVYSAGLCCHFCRNNDEDTIYKRSYRKSNPDDAELCH